MVHIRKTLTVGYARLNYRIISKTINVVRGRKTRCENIMFSMSAE